MKIAVHAHVFYPQMWSELQDCLSNIEGIEYDLFVTMVEQNTALEESILSVKQDAKIIILENRGYDIAPFFYVLNSLNLDDYEYLIKLHTKRNVVASAIINSFAVNGPKWREYLLSFCKNKKNFHLTLSNLKNFPKIGMITDGRLVVKQEPRGNRPTMEASIELMHKLDIPIKTQGFVAGTMFIARAKLFKILQHKAQYEDFPIYTKREVTSLAHSYERVLGYIVYSQDYIIEDFNRNLKVYECTSFARNLRKLLPLIKVFIYDDRVNQNKKRKIRIFRVPVYVKQMPADYDEDNEVEQ